tara:strand:- start:3704 stop:4804 length:1101 start_codon:yes stop_codon:yes gene_type:complete
MKYNGLITEYQRDVASELPYWDYGVIEDDVYKIDSLLHYGCFTLGYNQPSIIDKVAETVKSLKPEMAETLLPDETLRLNHVSFQLQDKLKQLTGYNSFYCLSGSDANEGAVKLASAYHHAKGNKNKKTILSFYDSYHGSTFLTSSIGCENLMADPFYTMDRYSGVKRVTRRFKIKDIDWTTISAIMVETCSYGGDMSPNTDEFWNKLKTIQQEHDVLIIVDDIFMGGGKTGNYLGWKHLPVTPDIFTMGKAITAGFFPLAITFYSDNVKQSLPENFRWDHGFTYNFSIPGVVSALEYLKILEGEQILDRHDEIVATANEVIESKGYHVLNRFGLYYMIRKDKDAMLYMIPMNATDQYFYHLGKNLK